MKAKTIKQVIRKKVDDWLVSIEDERVRELASKNTIVTGGCVASMLLAEDVRDFDLYFRDKETTIAVANYYVQRFKPKNVSGIECAIAVTVDGDRVRIMIKSSGIASEEGTKVPYDYFEGRPDGEAAPYVSDVMNDTGTIEETYEALEDEALDVGDEVDKPRYRPVFMSSNAVTLSHRVQIVIRFYGEPEEIHTNYDFIHCTNYWKSWDNELVLQKDALEALLARELRYVGSKYPVCSIIRMRKFIQRGWSINAGQILKMAMQVSALDLTNMEVLQDQLTGVDAAYFREVLSKLRDKDPEKVNHSYLIEIIDRMF